VAIEAPPRTSQSREFAAFLRCGEKAQGLRRRFVPDQAHGSFSPLASRNPDPDICLEADPKGMNRGNKLRNIKMGRLAEVKEDLRKHIKNENIDVAVTEREKQITLHAIASGRTLEITYDGSEFFRLKEVSGDHPKGFHAQVAAEAPRWTGRERPIAQSELLTKAKGWLNTQRAQVAD
jgi:hypothetical protein